MHDVDVLFVSDATPKTGFGHAARCVSIAQLLLKQDNSLRVGFQGQYSDGARSLLMHGLRTASFFTPETAVKAQVTVIDRMHDTEDPNAWDRDLLETLQKRSVSLVHLTSGMNDPALPDGITCIGFQPGGPPSRPPHLLWSMDFAPVSFSLEPEEKVERDPERLLVAFGGARDSSAIELTMGALEKLPQIASVDILGSPVNDPALLDAARSESREISLHNSVPSVLPLLRRARVVLVSFGHVVYEAMACGAAACVIGQKRFQAEMADCLAGEGLVVSGGLAADTTAISLASALEKTWTQAGKFAERGCRAVDGRGLDRIADVLLGKLGVPA